MGNKSGAMYYDTWKLHRNEISVSINKVLLEHGHAHFTCIIYGCFCATMTKMSSVTGTIWPEKLNVIIQPFTKKFANSCFKWIFLLHSPPQPSEVGKTKTVGLTSEKETEGWEKRWFTRSSLACPSSFLPVLPCIYSCLCLSLPFLTHYLSRNRVAFVTKAAL